MRDALAPQGHVHPHDSQPARAAARRSILGPAASDEAPQREAVRDNTAPPAPSTARATGFDRSVPRHARWLHFDCFSGLSGDMIVGALIDLGAPVAAIRQALDALPVRGYTADITEVEVSAIVATRFVVDVEPGQPMRTWRQIRALLEGAPALEEGVRARALRTFEALAIAEGRIHRVPPEEVHFHEVGAVDAIVDIVSASAALEALHAKLSCAPLPMGRGFTRSEHGWIPLPAPAVVELLAGAPTIPVPIEGELVTPTGAAIVRANVDTFTPWPAIKPERTGFGAGTRRLPDRPNVLRVVLGEPSTLAMTAPSTATHALIECNLDDATGELLAHATAALLREGALDAWTEPIGMKKSRPAVKLCALARAEDRDRLAAVMLRESPSLGVRTLDCARFERPRRTMTLETPWGPLPCKVSDGDGLPPTIKPEDDAVAALAAKARLPARVVRDAAMATLLREVFSATPDGRE